VTFVIYFVSFIRVCHKLLCFVFCSLTLLEILYFLENEENTAYYRLNVVQDVILWINRFVTGVNLKSNLLE